MLDIIETKSGVRIGIKVQPRSSRNQVVGEQGGALKIKLTAPPVEGEANAALIEYLAAFLDISRKDIRLIKGETSRLKIVEISGLNSDQFLTKTGLKTSS